MAKCGHLWPSGVLSWLLSAELVGMISCDFLVERNFREGKCLWMDLGELGNAHPLNISAGRPYQGEGGHC